MERSLRSTSFGNISFLHRPGRVPLIFLHGLGGSSNNWMRLERHLDPDYALYFIDLMGHGGSAEAVWNFTVDDQCRMLEEFISASGIENFALAGNSYGGWISATFAATRTSPDYLILEDSAGINPTVGEFGTDSVEKFIDRLQGFGRKNDRDVMRRIIEKNSTGSEKLSPEMLSAIESRTLVIWGDEDRMIDVQYGRELADHIGNSTFSIIRGAGHIPHYTHSREVAGLINSFVPV